MAITEWGHWPGEGPSCFRFPNIHGLGCRLDRTLVWRQ